jgi:glutathione S-transferase
LKRSDYIAGDSPTIADLLAYCELAQVPQALGYHYENLPELESWLESMSQLPHHDDVHKSLFKLGNMIQIIATKSRL